MELSHFTYLGLMLFTFIFPFALSFDKKVHFWKRWAYLFPSIVLTAVVFLIWDIRFTEGGIWSFNHEYTLGIYLKGLPLEEWLFFLVVPYASVFIYDVLKAYYSKFNIANYLVAASLVLIVFFTMLAFFNTSKLYTFGNFLFTAIFLAYVVFRNRFKQHLSHFYLSYLVTLIPFLLVNGILTYLPVVEYNQMHILNVRVFSIPFEDFAYFFLLQLMNTSIYEMLQGRKQPFFTQKP